MGQIYFLFGFLLFLTCFALIKKQYLFAGIVLAVLVLLRLNCLVFLLPFVFLLRPYRNFILGFFAGLAVYGLVLLGSAFERKNWKEYFEALHDYTEIHLGFLSPGSRSPEPEGINIEHLLPKVFEGEDLAAMKKLKEQTPATRVNSEPSNFFLVYKFIRHKAPSSLLLNGLLCGAFLLLLAGLFFKKNKQKERQMPLEPVLFSGILFYSLSCFLSPIITFPYQMPQWLAAAALIVIFHRKIPRILILFFLLGMAGYLVYFPDIKGKHALAEMTFLAATGCIVFWGKWWQPKMST